MLYGCAAWMLRPADFESLSAAHYRLLPRLVEFRSKEQTGFKTLSYRYVLEMTDCKGAETTTRERRLWFAGALVGQGEIGLPKRIVQTVSGVRGQVGWPPL